MRSVPRQQAFQKAIASFSSLFAYCSRRRTAPAFCLPIGLIVLVANLQPRASAGKVLGDLESTLVADFVDRHPPHRVGSAQTVWSPLIDSIKALRASIAR